MRSGFLYGGKTMAYYYFPDFEIDVFGYDPETETYIYSVQRTVFPFDCKIRRAKKQYKAPDKRNEWKFPHGTYINIIDIHGHKQRLFLDR